MKVDQFRTDRLKGEYNILCQRVFPSGQVRPPFGLTWCVVEPGRHTTPHSHVEGESFLVLEGEGRLDCDGRVSDVSSGDVIYLPPGSRHVLANTGDGDLKFLSLWWNPETEASALGKGSTLIYAAPPTPNGDLHLGHLSGPYLAADMMNRSLRARGRASLLLSGVDSHQSYVAARAMEAGGEPREVADRFTASIAGALRGAGVAVDSFLEPHRAQGYSACVQNFFRALKKKSALEEQFTPALFDGNSGQYLFEGFVAGLCPHCGSDTYGNLCEECGLPNRVVDLKEPSTRFGAGPCVERSVSRYHFPLSRYAARLRAYLETVEMPPAVRAYTRRVLSRGLPDIPVTHPFSWGVPVPESDAGVFHAWFEMAAAYLYQAESVGRSWRSENPPEVVLAFGFDNTFYYAFLLPALWMAYDEHLPLPGTFLTNQFMLLEGEKFSTSRHHAIWIHDELEETPADRLRFYLAFRRPEEERTDFRREDFRRITRELWEGPWECWLSTVDAALARTGRVSPGGEPGVSERRFLEGIRERTRHVMEGFGDSPRRAAGELTEVLRACVDFCRNQQPLLEDGGAALRIQLTLLHGVAGAAAILAPEFGSRLRAALGEGMEGGLFPAGMKVAPLLAAWVPPRAERGKPRRGTPGEVTYAGI